MKTKQIIELWNKPESVKWIWLPEERPNQYVAAVSKVKLTEKPKSAKIAIFADTKYKLYVNGRFVNAGPAPFWKPVIMIDEYDISDFVNKGINTICIVACFVGAITKYNLPEHAGIIALFEAKTSKRTICSFTGSDDWKIAELNCWNRNTPRRNWAIEFMEDLDLNHPDFSVLSIYAEEDYYRENLANFADLKWFSPKTFDRDDLEIRKRIVPLLRWKGDILTLPACIFRGNTEIYNLQDTALRLDHEYTWKEYEEAQYEYTKKGFVAVERSIGEPGFLFLYDFKRMMAGEPFAEIFVENPCTLDFAMAEDLRSDGRPIVWRNGGHYYARYHLAKGLNRIRFYHFNGYRFLYLVFKDAVGKVEIRKVVSKSCRSDLNFNDNFASNDRIYESIYRISRRSIKLNTQAFCYDCNTREQGTYLGDGLWIVESVGHMTGNFAHLRHLCLASNDEIKKTGPLLNASLFGMATALFDYCFVPVVGLKKYYDFTGDIDCVKACIDTCRAIIDKFREFRNEDGFISQKIIREKMGEKFEGFLFLDHPGMGWHSMTTVELDRRDINSGLNLYYLWALQSLSALEEILGNKSAGIDEEISYLSRKAKELFYIPKTGLIADAVNKDIENLRFSQIANALAIITDVLRGVEAEYALKTVLNIQRQTWISRGTPYSYFFLSEAATKCKRIIPGILHYFSDAFREHLERGATTTWESWHAENHDSRNHAWSAPIPDFLRCAVAGIRAQAPGYKEISVNPSFEAFDRFHLKCLVPDGEITVSWEKTSYKKFYLKVIVPENSKLVIIGDDNIIKTVMPTNKWDGEIDTK